MKPVAEHAHAVELAVGCDAADDAGAGRAVPAEVALAVRFRDRSPSGSRDRDGTGHAADKRMVGLDPAVDDAHPDAPAGRASERPLAVHPLGQGVDEPDLPSQPHWSETEPGNGSRRTACSSAPVIAPC